MARKTNKDRALALAAELGVEVDFGYMGEEGFEVALYGYNGHMAFDKWGEGHTAITNQAGTGITTEPGIWRVALRYLREFEPCADECHCRATDDPDVDVIDLDADTDDDAATDRDGSAFVTMAYVVTDDDSGAEYRGTAISAATPYETMPTMIALCFGVSRETVRAWETDNYREYQFDTGPSGYRGAVRFADLRPNPYRPSPVTLTHS